MSKFHRSVALGAALVLCVTAFAGLKEEMRQPWQRDTTDYVRGWKVAGAFKCDLARDCLDIPGGEAAANPSIAQKRADGTALEWTDHRSYADFIGFDAAKGARDGAVAYAATTIDRTEAGKASLSIGGSDGIRVWVNGKLVLFRDAHRAATADEDRVDVDLARGPNLLLVKAAATGTFIARVLEPGATLAPRAEIGPSIVEIHPDMFSVRTDTSAARADADPVRVELIKAGGDVVFDKTAKRGELLVVSAKDQPDGPYEVRASTKTASGRASVTYLPWFKGDALAFARQLAADAGRSGDDPAGFTLKMLAEMVDDRLGMPLADATGNPWPKIHSPLMEYAEIQLERAGKQDARVRAGGFVRLAWRDEVDATPQYARAYLPAAYDARKKWPLVLYFHGYNPPNPVYVKWWGADSRHPGIDTEFADGRQVIFIEPHGRGNTQYAGLGDADIMRTIAEAKRRFNVDENRIYLAGESMGGWGTWNVATRHPDVFAAIGPIFGGVDYHSQMSEEQLAALSPLDRYLAERASSWAQAEGLNNTPIFIRHGDADKSVNVEWTRWAVKLLQRWGYDVRYHEYPGRIHEALEATNTNLNLEWFLGHVRNPDPRHVRLRTAELRHASSFWVDVKQFASPLAFADVDAEIVERNVIRLDTRNVVDVTLTPSPALTDPAKPVTVVWNGASRQMRMSGGALRLVDPAWRAGKLVKNAELPGGLADFTTTPFAVVIGTSAKDPALAATVRAKAARFVEAWKQWQKYEPRVFEDSKIGAADLANYSLLLIGGPAENRVTAAFSKQLPLALTREAITIDGQRFAAADAVVNLLYPNPRNAQRYVWVVAANSADAMNLAEVTPHNLPIWDFTIEDGKTAGPEQTASGIRTAVVSGVFDGNWRAQQALSVAGDPAVRAQARQIRWRGVVVPAPVLAEIAGRYQLPNGAVAEVLRDGTGLIAKTGPEQDRMLPQDGGDFYLPRFSLWITFSRAGGKVTGFTGRQQGATFEARRLD